MRNKKRRSNHIDMIQVILIIAFVLVGSGSSYAAPDVVFKDSRPERDLTEKKEEAAYVYNPVGKTDPFAPFIVSAEQGLTGTQEKTAREGGSEWQSNMESILKDLKEPKTELQRIDISDLKLTSVIKGKDKAWAMVSDKEGRGYLIQKGTYIGTNGGIVDEIICEDKQTSFGIEAIRKITIKEPFFNQNKELDYKAVEMKMPLSVQN